MEGKNKELEVVMADEINKTRTVEAKKQKTYKTQDLVFVAIISFLIGAIIVAAGFTICNKTHKKEDFKQNGIQRNIGPGEFNNQKSDNRQNQNSNQGQSTPPSMPNNQPNNSQNTPPSIPNSQENQSLPNVDQNNNQNTTNKS